MANIYKWVDRLLTFITNNKLVSLLLPFIIAGGAYSTYEGYNLKDRVAALEDVPRETIVKTIELPAKPQEVQTCTCELESITSRMNHYHPE